MRNKNVGFLITGIGVIMGIMISIFDSSMRNNIALTCSHGPDCPMYSTLSTQTWLSLAVVALIILIGIFFIFAKEPERTIIKKIGEKKKSIDLSKLDGTEKKAVKLIQAENGAIFQATLMEALGIGKVGITRLLDKLEAKQIIERKRRGMNNIVVLK
jgi:uncharacterized membrane protein